MEDFKEIILYYKNYLLKKEKANLCEINIKSNENIKKYMENSRNKLRELENLSENYKLYDDNYNDFMIAMGKLALYLEKISEENKNNQFNEEIKMDFLNIHYSPEDIFAGKIDFLNMHSIFEELEQKNIMKDVYVWKFIGKNKEI